VALLEGAVIDATAHRQNMPALRGLNNLSSITTELDPRASLDRSKQGMATARRLGLRAFSTYQAGNAVGACEPLGEWSWARDTVAALLEEGDREEIDVAWLETVRDFFQAWTGDPDVARAERLLAAATREADYQTERSLAGFLGRSWFAAGDAARAFAVMEPFVQQGERADGFEFPMAVRCALHLGNTEFVRRALEIAGSEARGATDHALEGIRAGLAALEGRRDDAAELYRAALAGFRSYGMRFSFALTVFDMAKLLGIDDPAVRTVLEEGRGILEELGAQTLLTQLDALEAGARPAATRSEGRARPSAVTG
jgi:hypothetical protein